jgi:hypothetical protein
MLDTNEVDENGLTRKQRDMQNARNPLGGNAVNDVGEDQQQNTVQKQTKEQGVTNEPTRSKIRTGGAQSQQPVADVQKKLGSFSLKLQGAANDLLRGATNNSAVGIGTGQVKFDPTALQGQGAYVSVDGATRADTSAIENDKVAQLNKLKDSSKEFYETDKISGRVNGPKSFADTLRKFADQNGDGVIDSQEEQLLNQSTEIVQKIQQLNALGGKDSAEARALRAELQLYDQDGLVSGLLQAKNQYESLFGGGKDKYGNQTEGLKYYGDQGDEGVSITDLLSMSEDNVKKEVAEAVKGASGLFGGSFESNIRRQVDQDAASYKASQQERAGALNEFVNAGQAYVYDFEKKFTQQSEKFGQIFRKGAADFSQTTKASDNAKEWFNALADKPSQEITDTMLQVLQGENAGLSPDERNIVAEYIGSMPGINIDPKQLKLNKMLNELSTKGTFSLTDAQGNKKDYEPRPQDLVMLTQIMYNKTLTPEQKNAALIDAVDDSLNEATPLNKDYLKVQDYLATGRLESGIKAFTNNIESSLVVFDGSRTDELFDQVASKTPKEPNETGEKYVERVGIEVLRLKNDFQKNVASLEHSIKKVAAKAEENIVQGSQGLANVLSIPIADVMDEAKTNAAIEIYTNEKLQQSINEGMVKLKSGLQDQAPRDALQKSILEKGARGNALLTHISDNDLIFESGEKPDPQIFLWASDYKDFIARLTANMRDGVTEKEFVSASFENEKEVESQIHPTRLAQIKEYFKLKPFANMAHVLNGKKEVVSATANILTIFDTIGPDLKNNGKLSKIIKGNLEPSQIALFEELLKSPRKLGSIDSNFRNALIVLSARLKEILSNDGILKSAYSESFNGLSNSLRVQGRQLAQTASDIRNAKQKSQVQMAKVSELAKQSQTNVFTQNQLVDTAKRRLTGGLNFGGKVQDIASTNKDLTTANAQQAASFQAPDVDAFTKLQGQIRDQAAQSTSDSLGKFSNKNILDELA